MHLAHLETELMAKRRVLQDGKLGGIIFLCALYTSCTRASHAPCGAYTGQSTAALHRRAVRSCFCGAQPTKLKEYESNEKLASRARSEQLATSELLPTSFSGPIMSATVMSHVSDWSSLSASVEPRFATDCMSSAVSISCAMEKQMPFYSPAHGIKTRAFGKCRTKHSGVHTKRTGSPSRLSIFLAFGCE